MFNLDLDFLAGRGGRGGGGGGAGRTGDSKRARSLAAVNSHWKSSNTHYSQINCKESPPPRPLYLSASFSLRSLWMENTSGS